MIISEGADTSQAYLLDRGTVEVYLQGPPERRLRVLGPGEIFGEMALITEQPRSASVRALEDAEARVIARDEFLTTWRRDPDRCRSSRCCANASAPSPASSQS